MTPLTVRGCDIAAATLCRTFGQSRDHCSRSAASSSPGSKNGTAGEQGDGSPAISALLTSPVPLENRIRLLACSFAGRPGRYRSAHSRAAAAAAARPAGPPPRPSAEPVTAQRVASNAGVIMVAGQKIALGRIHARRIVTVHVAAEVITIDLGEDTRSVRRTTTQPVRSIKAQQPRKAAHVS